MRRLVTSLVILICFASLSFGQSMMQEKGKQGDGQKGMGKDMKGIQGTMKIGMPPMMSKIVQIILIKADSLDLSITQKKELSEIREKYVYPMIRNEGDFNISHMKVNDMLQNPDFDPKMVKAEIKILLDFSLKEVNMAIDAIAALRDVIGVDNFKVVMGVMTLKSSEMKKAGTIDEK